MRIVDESVLAAFRSALRCGYCGLWLRHRAHPHHLRAKGLGGGSRIDHPWNLIALGGEWDCGCHLQHHAGHEPLYCHLLAKVAAREGVLQHQIEDWISLVLRLPKGSALPPLPVPENQHDQNRVF